MANKKSIQVKGIKNLDKVEMKSTRAGEEPPECGLIYDGDIVVACTDSFTLIVIIPEAELVAQHFIFILDLT